MESDQQTENLTNESELVPQVRVGFYIAMGLLLVFGLVKLSLNLIALMKLAANGLDTAFEEVLWISLRVVAWTLHCILWVLAVRFLSGTRLTSQCVSTAKFWLGRQTIYWQDVVSVSSYLGSPVIVLEDRNTKFALSLNQYRNADIVAQYVCEQLPNHIEIPRELEAQLHKR